MWIKAQTNELINADRMTGIFIVKHFDKWRVNAYENVVENVFWTIGEYTAEEQAQQFLREFAINIDHNCKYMEAV